MNDALHVLALHVAARHVSDKDHMALAAWQGGCMAIASDWMVQI